MVGSSTWLGEHASNLHKERSIVLKLRQRISGVRSQDEDRRVDDFLAREVACELFNGRLGDAVKEPLI